MKQKRMILLTALSEVWNDGWSYKVGFELNGFEVIPMDSKSITSHGDVIKTVKEIKPDLVLHTKDEVPAEIFQEMRKYTKVVQWYPDPVIPDWLPPYVKASDIFFTMAEGLVDDFRKFNPNVVWLTQAVEPSVFPVTEITPADIKEFSADVTFMGNLGSKPYYLPRRKYLNTVLKNGIQLKWWGFKLPVKFSTLPLVFGKLGRSFGGRFVWGEEFVKVMKLSKIFLAFDALPDLRKSMSARLYYAVGCGAFYMCTHVDGIESVMEPGKEIVTFHSESEMIDLIRYYLKNDGLRKQIAEAGQKRVLSEHTCEVRIRQMMKIIDETL